MNTGAKLFKNISKLIKETYKNNISYSYWNYLMNIIDDLSFKNR